MASLSDTYQAIQAHHILALPPIRCRGRTYSRFEVQRQARRVHAVLFEALDAIGYRSALADPRRVLRLARSLLGLPEGLAGLLARLLAPLAQALLAAVLAQLLPLIIAWLQEQVDELTRSTGPGLNVGWNVQRLAREARFAMEIP